MHEKAEVWYQRGSAVSSLAESFRSQYYMRVIVAQSTARQDTNQHFHRDSAPPEPGAAPTVILADLGRQELMAFFKCEPSPSVRIIGFLPADSGGETHQVDANIGGKCFALLQGSVSRDQVLQSIKAALASIKLANDADSAAEHEREELNRIGIALSSTRDVGCLLEMILAKTREITAADAGSLYVVETSGSENGSSGHTERCLRFKLTQNDTRQFPYSEYTLPISEDSMAGYTALHGEAIALDDVYCVSTSRPYRFNPKYDIETGYRTRSLLTVPMKNARGDVLGVMQLLNHKRNRTARLVTSADIEQEVRPFPEKAVRLAESLASQAAVAYENGQLYQNIQEVFEGFVGAAATAIEQRDPTTSGHSARVTTMTLGLAEAVNRMKTGPYAHVHFTPEQMRELRYATLLHDFGKIAVRELLLVKAKKLYPPQLAIIKQRFAYLYQELETERVQKKLDAVLAHGNGFDHFEDVEEQYTHKQTELREDLQFIIRINDASILVEGMLDRLIDISRKTYREPEGLKHYLLTPEEIDSLSVRQGSLNDDERQQIESHVVHSFDFLAQIPWTPDLRYIPWIVRAHHEKLNGKGYPSGLRDDEIPVQAKMMSICDIFDALCAADRPYKKAVPITLAFEILENAVRRNELDSDLFRIFMEARVFDLIAGAHDRPDLFVQMK
jgi:HD-GYP domain-containing protein (c-di-GMP phosphodiesterase class II)